MVMSLPLILLACNPHGLLCLCPLFLCPFLLNICVAPYVLHSHAHTDVLTHDGSRVTRINQENPFVNLLPFYLPSPSSSCRHRCHRFRLAISPFHRTPSTRIRLNARVLQKSFHPTNHPVSTRSYIYPRASHPPQPLFKDSPSPQHKHKSRKVYLSTWYYDGVACTHIPTLPYPTTPVHTNMLRSKPRDGIQRAAHTYIEIW